LARWPEKRRKVDGCCTRLAPPAEHKCINHSQPQIDLTRTQWHSIANNRGSRHVYPAREQVISLIRDGKPLPLKYRAALFAEEDVQYVEATKALWLS